MVPRLAAQVIEDTVGALTSAVLAAIAWFRLEVVGRAVGPDGGARLTRTRFIQRVNTVGGMADPAACSAFSDVGKRVLVPYAADYVFYR